MIVTACEGTRVADTSVYNAAFIECYTSNGTVQWETALDSQHLESVLFVSAFDGTVAFVTRDLRDRSHNNLYLFTKHGRLIRQLPVYPYGSYQRSYFHTINGRQYFLSASGHTYYVIDAESGEIINRQTKGKEGTTVMGLAILGQYVVTSYCTGYSQLGSDNSRHHAIKNQGISIGKLQDKNVYIPLNMKGYPFIIINETGMFLREELGIYQPEKSKFYKINLK
jgi:outer membrane protein assembly factor BamB